MYPPDKIVDEPHQHFSSRFPRGFHWQSGSLDASNGRHRRRPQATKLHLHHTKNATVPTRHRHQHRGQRYIMSFCWSQNCAQRDFESPCETTSPFEHGTTCKVARDHSRNLVKLEESELSQRWPSTYRHLLLVASRTSVHNVAEHSVPLSAGHKYYCPLQDPAAISAVRVQWALNVHFTA